MTQPQTSGEIQAEREAREAAHARRRDARSRDAPRVRWPAHPRAPTPEMVEAGASRPGQFGSVAWLAQHWHAELIRETEARHAAQTRFEDAAHRLGLAALRELEDTLRIRHLLDMNLKLTQELQQLKTR